MDAKLSAMIFGLYKLGQLPTLDRSEVLTLFPKTLVANQPRHYGPYEELYPEHEKCWKGGMVHALIVVKINANIWTVLNKPSRL